jgi:hypothetical protein
MNPPNQICVYSNTAVHSIQEFIKKRLINRRLASDLPGIDAIQVARRDALGSQAKR